MADRLPDDAFTAPQVVDPGLRKVARFLPRGYALHRGLKLQRAIMNLMGNAGRLRTVPVVAVNEHVTVRLHRPPNLAEHASALLWIHGGGTVMGHAAQDDKYLRKLSHRTGVAIAAVEHRLAPEHPYPAPVEDCYAALLWLARQPWVDPERVAVGGASAGGLFAATLAQRAHDRNDVKIAFQMLVYPMLDDRTGAQRDGPRRLMWTESDNQLAWQWYLDGADPDEAAPARRRTCRACRRPGSASAPWTSLSGVPGVRAASARGRRSGAGGDRPRRVSRLRPDRGQGADLRQILRKSVRFSARCSRPQRVTSQPGPVHR